MGREGEGRAEAAEHLPEGVRWTPHQAGGLLQLQGPLAWPHPASWLPRPGRLCSLVNGARRSYFKSWQQFPVPGYQMVLKLLIKTVKLGTGLGADS